MANLIGLFSRGMHTRGGAPVTYGARFGGTHTVALAPNGAPVAVAAPNGNGTHVLTAAPNGQVVASPVVAGAAPVAVAAVVPTGAGTPIVAAAPNADTPQPIGPATPGMVPVDAALPIHGPGDRPAGSSIFGTPVYFDGQGNGQNGGSCYNRKFHGVFGAGPDGLGGAQFRRRTFW